MKLVENGRAIRAKVYIFIVLALLLSLWAVPVHAQSLPPIPHAFHGTVTIHGESASVGTIVTAKVSGVECGSYIVKVAGRYGDRSTADYLAAGGYIHEGDTINFYVNGVDTTQRATFEPGGGPTELNLSVTIARPTVTTNAATSVTTTSAILNGSLSSLGAASPVTVSFEWGTTTDYGNETTAQTVTSTGSFDAQLSGLTPATTYYFRAKAVINGTSYSSDRSFTTTVASGGSQTPVTGEVSSQGTITKPVNVTSEDGVCRLKIDKDVKALDTKGNPLSQIIITKVSKPPAPPKDASAMGLTYDFGPDGATFNPPIALEFSYDPSNIPAGVNEEDLVIAYYDKNAAKWIKLASTVNTATNTITALVSHFTAFAILGYKVVPSAPAAPAEFTPSSLTISPTTVAPGETVAISILIANAGGQSANYRVILKVGGAVEATTEVPVNAGTSKQVHFSTAKNVAGTYSVDVSGLTGSFAVKEAPPVPSPPSESPAPPPAPPVPSLPSESPAPPPAPPVPPAATPAEVPINWAVIGGIIGFVVLLITVILFVVRMRARY